MGQLLVSGLDDRIIQALEQRAARAGRTVEAEHRALLEEVLGPESTSFAGTTAMPSSRFEKALGMAGPGETTDEVMQWLRGANPEDVERAIKLIENARATRTPAEERAIDEFLKEIGAA